MLIGAGGKIEVIISKGYINIMNIPVAENQSPYEWQERIAKKLLFIYLEYPGTKYMAS